MFLAIAIFILDREVIIGLPGYLNLRPFITIVSLLLVSRGLMLSGALSRISLSLTRHVKGSALLLAIQIILISEAVSWLVMNDTALFIFIPLILTLSKVAGIDFKKLAILVTIGVNVGSALSPIGNPQNIIIWQHFRLNFLQFILTMLPFTAIATTILFVFCIPLMKGVELKVEVKAPKVKVNEQLAAASLALLLLIIIIAHLELELYGLLATMIVFLSIDRRVIKGIDLSLIIIFLLMFIDFGGISFILDRHGMISGLSGFTYIVFISSFLSQAISNVPTTIMLIHHVADWKALAYGVNLGGTGLFIGSLANVITLRLCKIGLREFSKYSMVYFFALLISLFLGYHYLDHFIPF